jgi:hypothetical protein
MAHAPQLLGGRLDQRIGGVRIGEDGNGILVLPFCCICLSVNQASTLSLRTDEPTFCELRLRGGQGQPEKESFLYW